MNRVYESLYIIEHLLATSKEASLSWATNFFVVSKHELYTIVKIVKSGNFHEINIGSLFNLENIKLVYLIVI